MSTHRILHLDDVEEIPVLGGTLRWKPLRRTLDVRAFGVNAYAADAGQQVVEEHDESGPGARHHEEMYVVLRGRARFALGGDEHEAPAGTVVFLPEPGLTRSAIALEDGTLVLAVGGERGGAYRPSAWEHWFMAHPHLAAGDFDRAVAAMRAGLPEHEGNAALHYNLASALARGGHADAAVAELRRALAADPERVREWAQDDRDLDPIRAHAQFPLA